MVRRHAGAVLALLAFPFAGCGEHRSLVAPMWGAAGDPPAVTVRATRIGPAAAAGLIRYRVDWHVPPGTADHFVYTLDTRASATVDARWTATHGTSFELAVPSRSAAMVRARDGQPVATTFLVRSVDRDGRVSPLQGISIVADNLAPEVQITQPVPSDRARNYVPPHVDIFWTGSDPDGQFTNKPVKYKYTLLTQNTEVSFQTALNYPDSVRRRYEPTGYAEWDSTSGDTTHVAFDNLILYADYMFVVVARDEQGAYTQVFSQNTNMLNMRISPVTQGGPRFTLSSAFFTYTYPVAVYSTDPAYQIPITIANNQPLTVSWSAEAASATTLHAYRWALDIADVFDETPRSDEDTDLAHWSAPSLATTSATVGPFGAAESHFLYVEGTDSNGLKSLAVVRINTTAAYESSHDLLIVDDTRYLLDRKSSGASCVTAPTGRWPTAAELDTFLYARGGCPWQCYPAGTVSPPGLFAGYDFDTLGTRGLPAGTVPLSTLLQYRRVIWLTDQLGALDISSPANLATAITSLRLMSSPGTENVLAEYVAAGGSLWIAGGGIATASMMPWNNRANDSSTFGPAFSSIPAGTAPPELGPGRFPYEIAGWRSEIRATSASATITRSLGRFAPGGTSYDGLPDAMRLRTAASDPVPPLRSAGFFYTTTAEVEYLDLPSEILGPGGAPDLDTLYSAAGAALVPPSANPSNVCMTVYHPAGRVPVIFTGFSLWGFQRADSKALVDWVLQNQWSSDPTPYSPPIREHDPEPIARRAR